MQDAEKADLRTQVFRVSGDLEQCRSTGLEQQSEEDLLVLPDQRHQGMRNAENQVIVADGEQFAFTGPEPLVAGIRLTFWTVTVAAGAVRDGLVTAASTLIAVPAECGSSATRDRGEYFELSPA